MAASADRINGVANEITAVLREEHGLGPGEDNDFMVRTQEDMTSMRTQTTQTMTGLLASIAGVSLIVGGIGIMNIMLVSVTERTREIGLRMAVGAKGRDVLLQFLVEAIVLSLVGGLVGVGLGFSLSEGLTQFLAWPTSVPAEGMSRPLLEFGGGSGDILRDLLHLRSVSEAEALISGAEGRDQLRHISMSLQAPEPLGRFEDAGRDPAQHHLAAPPALHVAFDMAGPADHAIDGVGRGQRALETRREAKRQHGQRLLEPFAHTGRRAGILLVETAGEVSQQPRRGLDVLALIGALEDRQYPEPLTLRQMVEDVAGFLNLTVRHDRPVVLASCRPSRLSAASGSDYRRGFPRCTDCRLFQSLRPKLRELAHRLRREEDELTTTMHAMQAEEWEVALQIDKVEAARSALSKTRTLMLYRMHRTLSADQVEALHAMWERRRSDGKSSSRNPD